MVGRQRRLRAGGVLSPSTMPFQAELPVPVQGYSAWLRWRDHGFGIYVLVRGVLTTGVLVFVGFWVLPILFGQQPYSLAHLQTGAVICTLGGALRGAWHWIVCERAWRKVTRGVDQDPALIG